MSAASGGSGAAAGRGAWLLGLVALLLAAQAGAEERVLVRWRMAPESAQVAAWLARVDGGAPLGPLAVNVRPDGVHEALVPIPGATWASVCVLGRNTAGDSPCSDSEWRFAPIDPAPLCGPGEVAVGGAAGLQPGPEGGQDRLVAARCVRPGALLGWCPEGRWRAAFPGSSGIALVCAWAPPE